MEDTDRLLHALQVAPRASWSVLGEVLKRPAGGLARRWQELSDARLAWITAVPFGRRRPGVLSFVALTANSQHHAELSARLAAIPAVLSIEEPARHWDFILTVLTANVDELLHDVLIRLRGMDGVRGRETIICTIVHFSGHEWRLSALRGDEERAVSLTAPHGPARPLRSEDATLLPFLHRDGRMPVAEIAAQLSVHPSTVSRRLSRLLTSGAISLRCDVAPELVGDPLSCQWFCQLPAQLHVAAARALRGFENLRFCASTTGQTNFTFVIWVRDVREIQEIEKSLADALPELRIEESSITTSFIKRMGWNLDEWGHRTGEPVTPQFVLSHATAPDSRG